MARKQKVQAPASAPLANPNPIVATIDHDDNYRAWRAARALQVYDTAEYSALTTLYEDYQAFTAASFGSDAVMAQHEFATLSKEWPHQIIKFLPIRRWNGVGPKFGQCVNLRLIPALRLVA